MVDILVLTELLAIIVPGVIGCLMLGYGVIRFPNVTKLFRYESRPISDLDDSQGPVKVQGKAQNGANGTVTAPFSGSSCLVYTYKVSEIYNSAHSDYRVGNGKWVMIDEGMDSVEMTVNDGTGRVSVDPTGADIYTSSFSETVEPGERPPERLAEYIATNPELKSPDGGSLSRLTQFGDDPLRFDEQRIDIGDDVTVYGQRRTTGPKSDVVIGDGEETSMFVISDMGTVKTAWYLVRRQVGFVLGGLVFLFVAFVEVAIAHVFGI